MKSNILELINCEDKRRASGKPETVSFDPSEVIAEARQYFGSERESYLKERAKEFGISLRELKNQIKDWDKQQAVKQGTCPFFALNDDGLYEKGGGLLGDDRVTGPLRITSGYHDNSGRTSGLTLEIPQSNGRPPVKVIINRCELVGDGKEAVKKLLDAGLELTGHPGAQRALARFLASVKPEHFKELVHQPGWDPSGVYVTAEGNLPAESDSLIFNGSGESLCMKTAGTLEDWEKNQARLAQGNKYLMLFINHALSALLLYLLGATTSIFNLYGNSSLGKTTILRVALSIYGSLLRMGSWRATDNGLEGRAAMAHHSYLALDEMGEINPRIVGTTAYMLGNGKGKARANRNGDARAEKTWCCAVGSTSERPLQEIMREAGVESKAGQEVRVIDVEIAPDSPYGAFQCIHEYPDGSAFAEALNAGAANYYGTPARAMIEAIQQLGFDAVRQQIEKTIAEFRRLYLPKGADGQVCRVCDRFGLIAAAGEFATTAGITGWEPGSALTHTGVVFDEWIVNRGGVGAREEQQILNQVTLFFEKYGMSRFEPMDPEHGGDFQRCPTQRAGYYRKDQGDTHHYVFTNVFKTEIAVGFNTKQVVKVLVDVGVLVLGPQNSKVMKDPTKQSIRIYHFVNVVGGGQSEGDYL